MTDLECWAWRLGPEGREKEGRQRGGRWQKLLTREEEAEWTRRRLGTRPQALSQHL